MIARNNDPWLKATRQNGVAHQRDAQLTWWSILQGIAMGEFIARIPTVWEKAWTSHHFYLIAFMFATFILLINVWVQMAWAIIILRWPLTTTHAILTTLLGIASTLLVNEMEQPFQWFIATGILAVTGIGIYTYNLTRKAYVGFMKGKYGWRPILETFIYLVIIMVLASWVYISHSPISYNISGILSVIIALISLHNQSVRMKYERQKLLLP